MRTHNCLLFSHHLNIHIQSSARKLEVILVRIKIIYPAKCLIEIIYSSPNQVLDLDDIRESILTAQKIWSKSFFFERELPIISMGIVTKIYCANIVARRLRPLNYSASANSISFIFLFLSSKEYRIFNNQLSKSSFCKRQIEQLFLLQKKRYIFVCVAGCQAKVAYCSSILTFARIMSGTLNPPAL